MEDDVFDAVTSHSVIPADNPSSQFHDSNDTADNAAAADPSTRTWRQELPRWLASLNPGRTAREYEKAVGYFFETPGVPQELSSLSFDLLLAYRGALALRAAPRTRGASYAPRPRRTPQSARAIGDFQSGQALPPSEQDEGKRPSDQSSPVEAPPLAPATVNLRLTALRQFLVHCALFDRLPQLSPERIRAALRRLPIEHRRPYQILDEAEWEGFLRAALLPATMAPTPTPTPTPAEREAAGSTHAMDEDKPRGPWGTPRAARAASTDHTSTPAAVSSETSDPERQPPAPVRSRFGLTGIRTAQRDHALVALALATGLRAVELSQLDIGDLQREWHDGREEWWLVLPDTKTKGQKGGRTLPLAPSLIETLMAYVRASGRKWEDAEDHAKPLFISVYERRKGRQTGSSPDEQHRSTIGALRLLPGQIARIVDRVEAQWLALRAEEAARGATMQAGETRSISTHALRHSTAVALLAGNADAGRPPASVEHVRGWLGHFDIRTTQGYLAHLDARRHRRPFALAPGSSSAPASTGAESGAPVDANERVPSRAPNET